MEKIKVDPRTTALVLIDLQNAIVGRDTAPYAAKAVVERCAELAERFRRQEALVIYVHVDLANFRVNTVDVPSGDPKASPPPPKASELVPEAGRLPGEILITKRHWSAFPGTVLEKELRSRGVKTIVIGGIATNFGVESTARDAAALGFDVVFPEDAMTSMSAELHRFAIENIFPRLGRVRTRDQIDF